MIIATCELSYLTYLLKDLQVPNPKPTNLHYDNQTILHIVVNPIYHELTKHIKLECHITQERIKRREVKTTQLQTGSKIADIFTKLLYS